MLDVIEVTGDRRVSVILRWRKLRLYHMCQTNARIKTENDAHKYWVQCAVERNVCGGEVVAHEIGAGDERRFEVLLPSRMAVARCSLCSP